MKSECEKSPRPSYSDSLEGSRPCARHRMWKRAGCLVAGVAILVAPLISAHGQKADYLLPGDPQRGMKVFFDKGCITCHSVLGEGGKSAPDLGKIPSGHLSAAQIAGVMWNHAPRMWEKMRVEKVDLPGISQEEMADLFAFLYSVRYFDEPGSPRRGEGLLAQKQCLTCHTIKGSGGRGGGDLAKWAKYANPILWVQVMWNHAPRMEGLMRDKGVSWPVFRSTDMVDLLAYVRSVAPPQKTRIYLLPADPKAGEALFQAKGCAACHSIRGIGGKAGPDLGARKTLFPRTLTQFAGLMWNHSPDMWVTMKKGNLERPQFSEREMADLIGYLFSVRFFDEPGDREAGARVFAEKRCSACHLAGGAAGGSAPDLGKWAGRVSPIMLSFVMWDHGPAMSRKMEEAGIAWPVFDKQEIVDLMEYLNTNRQGRR